MYLWGQMFWTVEIALRSQRLHYPQCTAIYDGPLKVKPACTNNHNTVYHRQNLFFFFQQLSRKWRDGTIVDFWVSLYITNLMRHLGSVPACSTPNIRNPSVWFRPLLSLQLFGPHGVSVQFKDRIMGSLPASLAYILSGHVHTHRTYCICCIPR